ncbi:uncharacterized protein [Nicotiana tomentosiformis]|uniref:uncharacterized protein n=1 Tax=Nicotiana tomentosiformis TaxID=4098 RepID=UPI00388CE64D
MSSEAFWRSDKFTKIFPVHFSGAPSEDPQEYLDSCHEVLRNMGIVETNGVHFAVFQMNGSAKKWLRDYLLTRLTGSPALSWDQFSQLFLEKFIPITLREEHRHQFKYLQQGSMTVTQYETHFLDLARHALILLPTKRERVRRFIDGLAQPIRLHMAKKTGSEIFFQAAANITRRVVMVLAQGSGQGFDNRPRHSGGLSGASSGGRVVPRISLSAPVYVSTPVGGAIIVDRVYCSCVVTIGSLETRDRLLLDKVDFDVILGIDWLSPYHAILDCHAKTVTLALPRLPLLERRGTPGHSTNRVISYVKARHMVEKECLVYLAYIHDSSAEVPFMDSVPVIHEFPEVFFADLP